MMTVLRPFSIKTYKIQQRHYYEQSNKWDIFVKKDIATLEKVRDSRRTSRDNYHRFQTIDMSTIQKVPEK
jgi:hypothetical protein